MGLLNSFVSTSLDLQNPKPGGLLNRADLTTKYIPSTATGTPVSNGNPGPFKLYYQSYIPSNTYIDSNPTNNSVLQNTLGATGLDDFTPLKDSTKYPATNTGTPNSQANPGAPSKFNQVYTSANTYLSTVGGGKLVSSVNSTNLDIEDTSPNGGIPYKQDKDPTVYSRYNTGTPNSQANPGAPNKFNQSLTPTDDYISTVGGGKLASSINSTNLDVENASPNGGIPYKQDKDPTVYPAYNTGTPNSQANPSAPSKFNQTLTPTNNYLSTVGEGKLILSVNSTNLDVEDNLPNGGIPYKQDKDPTVYSRYNTGTPNSQANPGAPSKFNQTVTPTNDYISTIGDGKLALSINSTNLDIENSLPNGGIPYKQDKDPTIYPSYNTGVPTSQANPGAPSKFNQSLTPTDNYLSTVGDGKLILSVDSTNFDLEDTNPNGGIPYKQDKDPTTYSRYNTGTPNSQANPGAPTKFNQTLTPTDDYVSTVGDGKLILSVDSTNLDIENTSPNGGIPYKVDKDPTIYPKYTTGKLLLNSGQDQNTPGSAQKFKPKYDPKNEYTQEQPAQLQESPYYSNLDSLINGKGIFKYNSTKDPTRYPEFSTQGYGPARKFNQIYSFLTKRYIFEVTRSKSKLFNYLVYQNFFPTELDAIYGVPYKQDKDPTVYPIYTTGKLIPSIFASEMNGYPGDPEKFDPKYNPENGYITAINEEGSSLIESFFNTNLDNTANRRDGTFIYKPDKDPTRYPRFSTRGYRGASKFNQVYGPSKMYVDDVLKSNNLTSKLFNSFSQTNFDLRSPAPDGGFPYKIQNDPTIYPITSTGRSAVRLSKTATGANRFYPLYNPRPAFTYLAFLKGTYNGFIQGKDEYTAGLTGRSPFLFLGSEPVKDPATGDIVNQKYTIFDITDLDVDSAKTNTLDQPNYPEFTVGYQLPDGRRLQRKFLHLWKPKRQYLKDQNNIVNRKGFLQASFENTNFDLENEKPNGGIPYKVENDPTVYPVRTQAKSPTPGFFATPGKAASKFSPQFSPKNTYLDFMEA